MTTFFAPGVEVLLRAVALGEEAGRLEHDVDAEVAPGHRGRVALGERLHLVAVRVQDAVARPRRRRGSGPSIESYLKQVRHRLQRRRDR